MLLYSVSSMFGLAWADVTERLFSKLRVFGANFGSCCFCKFDVGLRNQDNAPEILN